jgi:hypothetical protein
MHMLCRETTHTAGASTTLKINKIKMDVRYVCYRPSQTITACTTKHQDAQKLVEHGVMGNTHTMEVHGRRCHWSR